MRGRTDITRLRSEFLDRAQNVGLCNFKHNTGEDKSSLEMRFATRGQHAQRSDGVRTVVTSAPCNV